MRRASRNVAVITVVLVMVLLGGWGALNAEPTAHGADKGEQLHEAMEEMNKLFKQVRGSMKDVTKYPAGADAAAKMEALVVEAKVMMPEKVEKMPAEEQAKAMKQYRVDMCELLKHLADLEAAMLQGDQAKAGAAMAKCGEVMKTGHEAFREKE